MDYIDLNEMIEQIGRDVVPAEYAMKFIHSASRHIDTLTFGRIRKYGFDNLSEFQRDIIKECTAQLAKFEYENDDMITSFLSSYSINGVSMTFGNNWNIKVQNGVCVSTDIFNLLSQTGLTTLNLCI